MTRDAFLTFVRKCPVVRPGSCGLRRLSGFVVLAAVLCGALHAGGQQVTDRGYRPAVAEPAYPHGAGPRILIDEAHDNRMTIADRLAPFVALAADDGFVVEAARSRLTDSSLARAAILVASNANAPMDAGEVRAIERWVHRGGSLLLIADHMPFGGAASGLAAAFGVRFADAFTLPQELLALASADILEATYRHPATFSRAAGTLRAHPVTDGRSPRERIDHVTTFTGQAFPADGQEPLLVFGEGFVTVFPRAPWEFRSSDRRMPAAGQAQGTVKRHGAGRAAFFGEAAAFTAQHWGPERIPMGMNHPRADQNAQFVLNLLHWLARILD